MESQCKWLIIRFLVCIYLPSVLSQDTELQTASDVLLKCDSILEEQKNVGICVWYSELFGVINAVDKQCYTLREDYRLESTAVFFSLRVGTRWGVAWNSNGVP